MPRLFKKRELILLYVIFGLVSASLVFNFIAYPLWRENQNLDNEIARTKLKLVKYLEVLKRRDALKNETADSSSALTALQQKQDSPVAVLAELENISKKANIKIIDVRPQAATQTSRAKEISFDLRTEGNIEGYLKFIYEIENSIFLLQIKKILLRSTTVSSSIAGAFTIVHTAGN